MRLGHTRVQNSIAVYFLFFLTTLMVFGSVDLANAADTDTNVHYMTDQEREDWLVELNQRALQIVPRGSKVQAQDPVTVEHMQKHAGIGLDMTSIEGCQTIIKGTLESSPIYFLPGQVKVSRKGMQSVDLIVDFLNGCKQANIIVEGHTDSLGNTLTNQRLSGKRAAAVAKLLEQKGIDKARLRSVGYGDSRPLVANDTKANQARNRRIELTLY